MYDAKVLVDWYSFTVKAFPEFFDPRGIFPEYATMALEASLGELWAVLLFNTDSWQAAKSRPPYTTAIHRDHMFFIYAGTSQPHILVEISGKGCEALHQAKKLKTLIRITCERATRIDIAHDIKTAIRPMQVYDDGYSPKFKSSTTISSPTGETFYLGSPKSEKRVRVYVYNQPHPRAGILRFEYVFRKQSAKTTAARVCGEDLKSIVGACIATYGWKSALLKQDCYDGLVNVREERGSAKTLRWIITQVAPAVRRLIDDGVIDDPKQFFSANFMP